jgi:hypothetical protein
LADALISDQEILSGFCNFNQIRYLTDSIRDTIRRHCTHDKSKTSNLRRIFRMKFAIRHSFGFWFVLACHISVAQVQPEHHHPALLPCGTINPHLQYMVTSDQGMDHSGSVNRFDLIQPNVTVTQVVDDGFPSNGHGAARDMVQTTCILIFPGDEDNVYTKLNVSSAILAKSGCCGGLQPGGQASEQLEWQSSLLIPGDDDRWKLKVALNTTESANWDAYPRPAGKCTFSLDGETAYDLDWSQTAATISAEIHSGPHSLTLRCPQYGTNYRGAGKVEEHDVTLEQTLYVSASRLEKGPALGVK